METGITRNKLLATLKGRVPFPFVAALDQTHASRIVVRDPTDRSDGTPSGRWVVQIFRATPARGVTVWQNPALVLDATGGDQWIAAVDEQQEVTGFRDLIDLVDYVLTELSRYRRRRHAG